MVKLLPEQIEELDPNFQWVILTRLQFIDEAALGQQASGNGGPGREAAEMRMHLAVEQRDRKAEEEAIEDYMRAEVREWWENFPRRELLANLYQRDARRKEGCSACDYCRPPTHSEGLRVAEIMLADVPDPKQFSPEWTSEAVSEVLAALLLPPYGKSSPGKLQEYVERSEVCRAYFDALERLWEEHQKKGRAVPQPLFKSQRKAGARLLRRPASKRVPRHRPLNMAWLLRDFQIQFVILVLCRLGVPPSGSADRVSACRIAAEALGISEDSARRIWKHRIWRKPFAFLVRKYSRDIAERTGLDQFHRG